MDVIYGSDRKLSELGERDLSDFLDHDLFKVAHGLPHQNCYMDFPLDGYSLEDGTWINTYLNPALDNDLIEEPRLVKTEHSYSLDKGIDDPVDLTYDGKMEIEQDTELLDAINPNLTSMCDPAFVTSISTCDDSGLSSDLNTSSINVSTSCPSILHRTVNCVDKTFPNTLGFPLDIKEEPFDDLSEPGNDLGHTDLYDANLPLTPPLSSPSSSDTEGSQSILASNPPSPSHKRSALRHEVSVTSKQHLNPWTSNISQPACLFANNIPSSGILILTEEEKRTLIAEGYPLPTKLPLTKQEEKNLKKIRRKIKNKISAQESRRKKKEYLESLEKRVESMSQENMGLKKKIDILENSNRSLATELQKLQSMASKVVRVSSTGPVHVGACLMVN